MQAFTGVRLRLQLTEDFPRRLGEQGPWLGEQAGSASAVCTRAGADNRGPEAAGRWGAPPLPAYLELPEELGDLSAVQLLAGLLVSADDLVHSHVLGCGHRGPQPMTLHILGPSHPRPSGPRPLPAPFPSQQPTELCSPAEGPCCPGKVPPNQVTPTSTPPHGSLSNFTQTIHS